MRQISTLWFVFNLSATRCTIALVFPFFLGLPERSSIFIFNPQISIFLTLLLNKVYQQNMESLSFTQGNARRSLGFFGRTQCCLTHARLCLSDVFCISVRNVFPHPEGGPQALTHPAAGLDLLRRLVLVDDGHHDGGDVLGCAAGKVQHGVPCLRPPPWGG